MTAPDLESEDFPNVLIDSTISTGEDFSFNKDLIR